LASIKEGRDKPLNPFPKKKKDNLLFKLLSLLFCVLVLNDDEIFSKK
jgi:hypothetical protein